MRRSAFIRFFGLTALLVPSAAYADLPCKGHEPGENIYLKSPLLDEISGMALSRTNEDIIWGHVDSDGAASLYAIKPNGDYVRKVIVKDVNNTDWEDIAAGPCSPDDLSSHCLFIADMGDNTFKRTDKKIHVLKDPVITSMDRDVPMEVEVEKTIFVTYTGLEATEAKFNNPDSESLMVDPRDGTIYIISKQSSGGEQTLYRIEPQSCGERVGAAAVPLASFTFTSILGSIKPLMNAVTAADFSPDGTHYLVRTYAAIYEYDVTSKSVAEAFLKPDSEFMPSELQGEAATYMPDGKTILTAAEKYETLAPHPLFHVNTCKDTISSDATFSEGTIVKAIAYDVEAVCKAANAVPAWTYKLVEDNDIDEICDNEIDDNGDGLIDCKDPECRYDSYCVGKIEICGNGLDDDGNGLADCDDEACKALDECVPKVEICGNGVDDDGNGLTDCDDEACKSLDACAPKVEICGNGVDDDGNGLTDCDDEACKSLDACVPKVEICDNGLDDDGNGLTDCDDEACKSLDACKKDDSGSGDDSGEAQKPNDEQKPEQNEDQASDDEKSDGGSAANEKSEETKSSSSDSCSCLTVRNASGVSLTAVLLMLMSAFVFWRRRRSE